MKDLLEQLMQLNEAPVKPGERKGISFKLKKLEKISDRLRQYQNSMSHMKMAQLPGELQKEMQQLQDKLNAEIDKVDKAYQIEYENSKVNGRPVKMDNLFKALAKNCKEIIKVYKELNRNDFSKGRFLYRGIRSSDDALYGKPFDARKPKDSNRDLHELVNGTINNLGLPANRENSMFVTGDRSQASGYGNSLYIMFPIDGFTFTWSQTVKDLVLDSSKRQDLLDKEVISKIREMVKNAKAKSKEPSEFPIYDPDDLFYSGYDYDNHRAKVSRAIEQGLLPDKAQKLLDTLITDDSIQDHFKFTDQNLFNAILSDKEIYIRGDYYAVNVEHSAELFKFLEEMNTDNVELPESFGEVPNILDKGDVVKILSGSHAGKLGTITYTYSDMYEVFVSHTVGDTTIAKDQVELYYLPDGSIPIYEKNDKVIVTDSQSRLYGNVGQIASVYSNGKIEISDDKGIEHTVYKNQIEQYTPEREQEIQQDLATRPPKINEQDEVIVSDPASAYYGESGRANFVYSSGNVEVYFPKRSMYVDFEPTQIVLAKNAPPELLKTEPEPETENQSELKVGDTVQIINDESSYYGEIGEVIEVGQTPDGTPTIKFKNAKSPSGIKTFASWVEKVDQPKQDQQTFNINDVVKIKDKSYDVDGSTATVIKGPDSDGDYKVVTTDGKILFTSAFQMEKIEGAEKTFNVGDAVKVIGGGDSKTGEVGEIQKGPDGDGDFTVIFGDGDWGYYQPYQLEKASSTQASPAFTEGETVKLTGPSAYNNSSYIGYTGTITSVSDDGKFVGVRISDDEDTILTYDVSNVSKTEGSSQPEVKTPLKVGDTVKNIKNDHSQYGQTAEVKTIYSSGNLGLVYADGSQAIDPSGWLEKVESPAQPEASKFEVNDRVEVESQFPSLIGMKGTIIQASPNFDFVSVQLDGNTAASSFPTSALKKVDANDPTEFHLGDMIEVTNDSLASYGQKGKVTDMDVNMLVVQDSTTGDVFFAKKANVKKIG